MEKWGKDHWSTLAYVESRIVSYEGVLNREHMRCDIEVHPGFGNSANGFSRAKYPTRLKDDIEVYEHDDWSCIDDAIREGLIEWHGTGIHPFFKLTVFGNMIAAELREHKGDGGQFRDFVPSTLKPEYLKQRWRKLSKPQKKVLILQRRGPGSTPLGYCRSLRVLAREKLHSGDDVTLQLTPMGERLATFGKGLRA